MVKNIMVVLDWNSLISALIGGLLALLGAYLTMKGMTRENERKDSRELVPLFYFLNSKAVLLVKLSKHLEAVSTTKIVNEEEVSDIRKRLSFASRALSLKEIGDINSFCNQLIVLEGTRKDCYGASHKAYSHNIIIYQKALQGCIQLLSNGEGTNGINEIGMKLEAYISRKIA